MVTTSPSTQGRVDYMKDKPVMRCMLADGSCYLGYICAGLCKDTCGVPNSSAACHAISNQVGCLRDRIGATRIQLGWFPVPRAVYDKYPRLPSGKHDSISPPPRRPVAEPRMHRVAAAPLAVEIVEVYAVSPVSARKLAVREWHKRHRQHHMEIIA